MRNLIKKLDHFGYIILLILHVIYGHSTITYEEDNSICGITEKQIQESLSPSYVYPIRGIAVNPKCPDQNKNIDQCLTEQKKLIECLQEEYFKAQKNRESEPSQVEFKQLQKQKCPGVDKYDWKNIADGNEELDIVAKDYDETVAEHLQSIANVTKKSDCVDNLRMALIGAKFELSTVLRQRILEENADDARRLGVRRVANYLPEDANESEI